MMKKYLITISMLWMLLISQLTIAGTGLLFNVSASGQAANVSITLCLSGKGPFSCQNYTVSALNVSINTVAANHLYREAGIRINTPGYSIANLGVSCAPSSHGYCLFSVSDTTAAHIDISKNSGYTLGGTVSGLNVSGLVLQNNGADFLTVASGATSFQFATTIPFDSSYNVTVKQQPAGLTCTVGNGSGSFVNKNVTDITVVCNGTTYSVSGVISGLTANGLVLQNNGTDDLSRSSGDTSFIFSTPIAYNGSYNVTIKQQPAGLVRTVNNGAGTNITANVTNITITCDTRTFTIGGTITGLIADGLVLQNNGADNLSVPLSSTAFTFGTKVAYNGSYNVTVKQQPTGLVCTVNNGAGTNITANVTNITITCDTRTFTIGGTITGLTASGLVLQNNGADNLSVLPSSTAFTFGTKVAYGGSYNVTVKQQPQGLICTVSNGSGMNVTADISNIAISCNASSFTIGGSITGLNTSGLVLQNNGSDNLFISSGASSFTFPTPVASGGSYNVTVRQQPTGLVCIVNNGSGSNVTTRITSVMVNCHRSFAYVGNSGAASISAYAIDTKSGALRPIDTSPFTAGGGPNQVLFTPDGKFAYATNSNSGNISAYSVNEFTGALNSISGSPFLAGTNPGGGAFANNGAFFYVANYSSNSISAYSIHPSTGVLSPIAGSPFSAGTNPSAVNISPNGKFVYAANSGGNNISVYTIDMSTGALTAQTSVTAGTNPSPVTFSPSGNFAYVANFGGNTISAYSVNSTTGALIPIAGSTTGAGPAGVTISSNGKFAYVANSAGNSISTYSIDTSTGVLTLHSSTPTQSNPSVVAISQNGKFAYVANANSGTISAYSIDLSTGALQEIYGSPFSAGTNPDGLTFSQDGSFVYVANSGSANISAYAVDANTGALTEATGSPFASGASPLVVTGPTLIVGNN